MSAAASSTPLATIQAILATASTVGRPKAEICSAIANLKDMCELGGNFAGDWRRGTGGSGRGGGVASYSPKGGRPVFRSNTSGSLASQASAGSTSPTTPIPRNPSARSFGSGGDTPLTPGPPVGRYQSRFKNSVQPVENRILNNIILSKLNKFSAATYDDIRDFLYQILGSGEPDLAAMIRDFMMLVFRKAASEEFYCPLYAKLLAEISGRYTVILEEMAKLQANYLEIFDDVAEVAEGDDNYNTLVAKNKEKQYRQGYSQFLAELAALEIVTSDHLTQTFQRLMSQMRLIGVQADKKALMEEYADCLVRMCKVFKNKNGPFFISTRAALAKDCSAAVEDLLQNRANYPSFTAKARFTLMDVKEILGQK